MSVAFRRESDEEHREPRFELPVPSGPNLVTTRGMALIEERVAELERDLAAATGEARDAIARDLRYWNTRAVTAVPTSPPLNDEVGFGSCVRVRLRGGERWFTLVGDDQAAPGAGLIAWSAPLARALTGAMVGEQVPFASDLVEVLEIAAEEQP